MLRFAANLSMLYPELPFLDRFEAAAHDGFEAVECLFPYDWPVAELRARLQGNGLQLVLFNAPPGIGLSVSGDWGGPSPRQLPVVSVSRCTLHGSCRETLIVQG